MPSFCGRLLFFVRGFLRCSFIECDIHQKHTMSDIQKQKAKKPLADERRQLQLIIL